MNNLYACAFNRSMLWEKASSSLIEVKRNVKITCFQDDRVHKGTCVHNVLQEGGLVWRCGYWHELGMSVPEEKRIVTCLAGEPTSIPADII